MEQATQHFAQMATGDWGSPQPIVQAAHTFFGQAPDLDPASSAERNRVVQAGDWLGLPHVAAPHEIPPRSLWGDAKKIFINPPGGGGKRSFAAQFWDAACEHLIDVDGSELIWVAYNINQLQTLQQSPWWKDVSPYTAVCVPSLRVKYLDGEHKPRSGTPSASAILCVSSEPDARPRFQHAFSHLGQVW